MAMKNTQNEKLNISPLYERLDNQVKVLMDSSEKHKNFIENNWNSILDRFAEYLEEMLYEMEEEEEI